MAAITVFESSILNNLCKIRRTVREKKKQKEKLRNCDTTMRETN